MFRNISVSVERNRFNMLISQVLVGRCDASCFKSNASCKESSSVFTTGVKPRVINPFIKTSQQQHRLHVSMVRDHQRHEQLTNSWIEPPSDSSNICSAVLQLEVFQYLNVADVVRHVSKSRKKLITFLNWSVDKSRCLEGSLICT